jgi:magnesium-transporting ATPase (P-type)
MQRKPRDPLSDRLVSPALLFYSYVMAGGILSVGCFLAYMFIYLDHDIKLSDFPINDPATNRPGDYFSLSASDPVTIPRTGATFTVSEQKSIFSQGVTAFYITLTCTQFLHTWVCKTRTNSIFVHGFSNRLTFYGVFVGFCLVIFFSYVPGVHNFVGSAVVGWIPWVVTPATGAVLWIYAEGSKWFYRRYPKHAVAKALAW